MGVVEQNFLDLRTQNRMLQMEVERLTGVVDATTKYHLKLRLALVRALEIALRCCTTEQRRELEEYRRQVL